MICELHLKPIYIVTAMLTTASMYANLRPGLAEAVFI